MYGDVEFESLVGKTLVAIDRDGDERLTFRTADEAFVMLHHNNCCENVEIAEIVGDLDDLIGAPILLAELASHKDETPEGVAPPEYPDSYTWSFYKLATHKGHVTIRWLGESNGYYSEEVDFERA